MASARVIVRFETLPISGAFSLNVCMNSPLLSLGRPLG
jgi:hypothetical protein